MRALISAGAACRNRREPGPKKCKKRENRYGATPVRRSPAAARYVYTRRIYATLRYARLRYATPPTDLPALFICDVRSPAPPCSAHMTPPDTGCQPAPNERSESLRANPIRVAQVLQRFPPPIPSQPLSARGARPRGQAYQLPHPL
jgi:hypothetical protein